MGKTWYLIRLFQTSNSRKKKLVYDHFFYRKCCNTYEFPKLLSKYILFPVIMFRNGHQMRCKKKILPRVLIFKSTTKQTLGGVSFCSSSIRLQWIHNAIFPKSTRDTNRKNGQFIQYACSSKDQTLWRTILSTSLLACMKSLASNLSLITVTSSNSPFFWKELAYILLIYL